MAEPGRIYTRTGDMGSSAALDGRRRPKSDSLFRALGALEELSASLGSAAADGSLPEQTRADLYRIQNSIFVAGAAMAGDGPETSADRLRGETTWLESRIDSLQATLPPLTHFILPGGSQAGAALHWARTICRRAETEAVAFFIVEAQETAAGNLPRDSAGDRSAGMRRTDDDSSCCLPDRIAFMGWMNRLSDALFVLARAANSHLGVAETVWAGGTHDTRGRTG